jgi:hypothetical protein
MVGVCAALGAVLLIAGTAHAVTAADKCEAAKLKIAGKYDFCRLKAEAKAAKTGGMPDFTKCGPSFSGKWSQAEMKAGGMCPSNGDAAAIQAFIIEHDEAVEAALDGGPLPMGVLNCNTDLAICGTDLASCNADLATCLAAKSAPLKTGQTTPYGTGSDGDLQRGVAHSYTDNGDGTITDNTTGLMWEKKDQSGGIHDYSNIYYWGQFGQYTMNGTMVTTFLSALNGSAFAGHSDWRIPNRFELESLLNLGASPGSPTIDPVFNTGCVAGCTVTTCSCTRPEDHWSSTTNQLGLAYATAVNFYNAGVINDPKDGNNSVRAVRGGS